MDPNTESMNQLVLSTQRLRFLVCTMKKLPLNCLWWLQRIRLSNDVKCVAQYIIHHQDFAQSDLNCLHQNNWTHRKNHQHIYIIRVEHQLWEEICCFACDSGGRNTVSFCFHGGKS